MEYSVNELREPLTEFTSRATVDIHWFALDDGRVATNNLVARHRPEWLARPDIVTGTPTIRFEETT